MRAFSHLSTSAIVIFATLLFRVKTIVASDTESADSPRTEEDAKTFLARYNDEYSALLTNYTHASWDYHTNLTEHNAALLEAVSSQYSAYTAEAYRRASRFNTTGFDYNTKRLLSKVGSPGLKPEDEKALSQILNEMGRIYGSHQVMKDGKGYLFEPDLKTIMETSTNASERLWAWQSWHDDVGRAIRPHYIKYVELKNRLAQLRNFTDYGDEWRQNYETEELEPIVLELYRQLEPLYKQLHAYIRRRLYKTYGPEVIDLKGPLPAHLLGDMWGRFWSGLGNIVQPYPNRTSVDPTPAMNQQNYTVRQMFELGDDFFQSMGLKPLPDTFYNLSMLKKPEDPDRKVICHATAWEFGDGKDFRIKMCSKITFDDFLTVHHELGHVQYFMQYAHQPVGYRDGANNGFHEAIGELMSMSVATTKHLHTIGLLDSNEDDPEIDINFLMQQALSTISTLPFHLVQDVWRWKIFSGEIPVEKWNEDYWNRKFEILGVAPAVPRNGSLDLDPVAIYHVCNDYDMIRYFTRTVLQFQFNEALCKIAGHEGPLHKCDFYNSTEAGEALARMMRMGSSRPWPDAMEALTGQREMSTKPLLNYFKPLQEWLEKENKLNGELIGWLPSSPAESMTINDPNKKAKSLNLTNMIGEDHQHATSSSKECHSSNMYSVALWLTFCLVSFLCVS